MLYALLLPSWYPDEEFPLDGNFIARHAEIIHNEVMPVKIVHARIGSKTLLDTEVTPKGLKIYRIQLKKIAPGIAWWQIKEAILDKASDIIKKFGKPAFIHVHVAWPALFPAYILAKKFDIPLLLTEHHSLWLPQNFNRAAFFKRYILKKLISKVNGITAVSDLLAQELQSYSGQKPLLIPNLVQDGYFQPYTPSPSTKYTFVHISNFAEVKRPVEILRAYLKSRSEGMDAKLIMAGEPGPLKEQCRTIASSSEFAGDIEIREQMSAEETCTLMRNCDALVGYSTFETQGITMAEAFALGKRVIQYDLPVLNIYPEWFPLHKVKDELSLAATMKTVSNMAAPENTKAMGTFIQQQMGRKAITGLFQKLYQI